MDLLLGAFCVLTLVAMLLLVAATVTSWFAVQPGTGLERMAVALQNVVDPVLAPLRARLPQPAVAGTPVDVSPLVVLLLLWAVRLVIGC